MRETWGVVSHDYDANDNIVECPPDRSSMIIKDMKFGQGYYSGNIIYRSDGEFTWSDDYGDEISAWKPSIHMPKKLSRITLKVTDVRIERIQCITEEQAKSEGVRKTLWFTPNGAKEDDWVNLGGLMKAQYKNGFASICDSIYSNWNDNPYVWVIEFEVIKGDSNES